MNRSRAPRSDDHLRHEQSETNKLAYRIYNGKLKRGERVANKDSISERGRWFLDIGDGVLEVRGA